MSTTISTRLDETSDHSDQGDSAGVARSEPVGRAERRAGAARRSAPLPRPELAAEVRALLPDELIDELLAGARTEEEIAGPGGLLSQLTKRLVERAMEVELTAHLGYEPHQEPPGGAGNTRNGSTPKMLVTESGPVRIDTPRDRAGTFEPQIIRKRQRRFEGFDDKILALYSRGLSTRDIEAHLQEIYGVKVGRDLISRVTDAVMDDARAWQTRPLDDVYPVVFLDALVLKVRDGGSVQRRACYLALAINIDGDRDVLGMWFQANEGAKFWMQVLTDLKQRGVQDILIACVDGLKGFPEAIEAIFPATTVQTCIVHLIRHSLRYVPRRQYDAVVKDLKPIYTAVDADHALLALEAFEEKWGEQLPVIGQAWRDAWEHVIPFMAYEPEVRRVIYTTNAIEALNRQLRKALKTKGSFPSEDAARKLVYLAIQNAVPQWTRTRGWTKALLAFKIQFGDRLPD
jgi:putative transposase